MEIQDPRAKHAEASPNPNNESSPQWRGHSVEALRESEARVSEANAAMREFRESIQAQMDALKEQIRVSKSARNEELARLLALEPVPDHYDEDWRPDPEELIMGYWKCPDSPTGHCIYDDEEDINHDCCLICGDPSERK